MGNITRIMYLLPEDTIHVDIRGVSDKVMTLQALHKMRDDVEYFSVKDSFGRTSKFVFDGGLTTHRAFVMKAISGNAHVVAGPNTLNFKHLKTSVVEQKTIEELSKIRFEEVMPHVLMPKKRTYLEDYGYFLSNLDDEDGYTINLPDFSEMNKRLKQLSNAGVTCRPHPNIPKIHVGETQPICWLMKLLINGLNDDYSRCEEMLNDLVTRGIIKPFLPWTSAQSRIIHSDKCIYEGGREANYMPILKPVETSEECEAYKLIFIDGDVIDVQTSWYCA